MAFISFKKVYKKMLEAQMETDNEAVKNIQRTAAYNERQRWAKRLREILANRDFSPAHYEAPIRGMAEALEENDLFMGGQDNDERSEKHDN